MEIKTILTTFFQTTMHLKKYATMGTYNALCKVVIGIEYLVQLLEENYL